MDAMELDLLESEEIYQRIEAPPRQTHILAKSNGHIITRKVLTRRGKQQREWRTIVPEVSST